jgi:hypothetical protein
VPGTSLDFTHIYAFDRVFSPKTLAALAAILRTSPFYVLVSYRPPAEWWQHGLSIVQARLGPGPGARGRDRVRVRLRLVRLRLRLRLRVRVRSTGSVANTLEPSE